ncbi:MAG: hydantoinase/oxoprolinase family protein, partial [Actinobacteria bacterium]|nr:hydantoinase/oxoprolinase family protein [Actinomycetota bacterium]
MTYRIGVDIGGTFTDLVVYDEATAEIRKTKTLTTPAMPEEGLLAACRERGVDAADVTHFLHATTLVTNLLIQRAGDDVGLVTTKGFRHCLEVGDGRRADTYSLQWERPRPFAPTHLVGEVDERVDAHGRVVRSLDRTDVERALRVLLATGVKSIAVSLLHSYANPVHEHQVAEILRELAPDVYVSLSSEVDPRIREYQRTSTTVLNAYAMPRVHGYVDRLDRALPVRHGINYMHSGGGIVPSTVARRFPVMLVESGPAAGVLAGAFLGQRLGIANIMTADMGGTSYDVCVIRGGVPEIKDTVEVEPTIPLRTECIDVMSIGAGGGSIAWIDEGGALKVGPRSAGSHPGPACYGRGGTQPTVTDANVVLGLLAPDTVLGGALRIDLARAQEAIRPLAGQFKVSLEEAAQGVYRIVNANMAQAMRKITVHKGIDPREFTLIPFGGAGGQHAVELARELGMAAVLFPSNASVLSAFGLLTADLKYTATNSVWHPLDAIAPETLEGYFKELATRAIASLHAEERAAIVRVTADRSLDVRYIGQSYDLRVPVDDGPIDRAAIYRTFETMYRARYGVALGDPVEIINAHVTATGHLKRLELPRAAGSRTRRRPRPRGARTVALTGQAAPVYDRGDLAHGMRIVGACLIEESDTTIYVPDGCVSEIDAHGN